MASAQLQLITTDTTWKLDRRTVEIGRAGIAQARAALAAATVVPELDIFGNEVAAQEPETVNHQVAA